MQKFNPDCVITIYIFSRSKPTRHSYGIRIEDGDKNLLVEFSAYMGECQKSQVEYTVAALAFEQAVRLRREKLYVFFDTEFDHKVFALPRGARPKSGVESIYRRIEAASEGINLKKMEAVPRPKLEQAMLLAERAMQK